MVRLEETVTSLMREIASVGLTPIGANYVRPLLHLGAPLSRKDLGNVGEQKREQIKQLGVD